MRFDCPHCRTLLSASPEQAGHAVRCPACNRTLTVPSASLPSPVPPATAPPRIPASVPTPPFGTPPRRFGFPCPYCASRLDANETLSGTVGRCPTCDSSITIPHLDRFGRAIDPATQKVIKPDPHPVHAYAAAGAAAPRLKRLRTGQQVIVCARCAAECPVTADACRVCGVPFTLEGTRSPEGSESYSLTTASLVLGIVSIPAFCLVIPGPLAVLFGGIALFKMQGLDNAPRGTAITGLICGLIGSLLSLFFLVG
ncbi:MAG: DUF4190 domain-containing protein [Tepidisphaerales bacterium]